jgi:large subunit ribosomal protein L25
MPDIVLHAEVGRPLGTRATRRLRRAGKIPAVVYGHGSDPVPVAVVGRDLRTALSGDAGTNALLSLQTDDQTFLALARELQRDPVKGTVTHVDFQIVRRDEVISAEVPVTLIGEALEVVHGDGLVDQQLFSLSVNARPADIPTGIEVDISDMTIGDSIRVADLPLPAGVTTDVDPEAPVATGQPPRVQALEEAEGEGAEGAEEEGAAAPSEETATPSGEE